MTNNFLLRMASIFWCALVLFFVYAPIAIMIAFSFNSGDGFSWTGFSMQWYSKFIGSADMLSALLGSLLVGVFATFCSVTLSLLVVVASRWWKAWWLLEIFMINFSIPEIFLAVVVFSVFVFLKVNMGLMSLVVGHTLIGFGMSIPILRSSFSEINQSLIDSSLDLGATYLQTFWYVILPILRPVIIYASFMVFTLSMDDFFINFFCSGVGFPTVSTHVYTTIRVTVDPSLNALSSTLFFLSLTLVIVLALSKSIDKVLNDD